MLDGMLEACRLLQATSGKGRYFCNYPGLEKMPSRLPVYARRRAATFDTPVPRNASNIFEVMMLNGTAETTSDRRMTWYIYGEQIIRMSVRNCT